MIRVKRMKYLCDQMAAGLGKWLRIAGYDTAIIEDSESDEMICQRALQEGRVLITCDHHFLKLEISARQLIFLKGNSLEEWIAELDVDWLHRPFSRCLTCNATLIEAEPGIVREQAPPAVQANHIHYKYCTACQKIFWEGSHTEAMRKQLESWHKRS